MALVGIVDTSTGAAHPVADAAGALLSATAPAQARGVLGLGSVATLDAEDVATATQGALGEQAHVWGDHRSIGYLAVAADNQLPAVRGANLLELPPPLVAQSTTQVTVANSTAATTIASIVIPAGALATDGQWLALELQGEYMNTSGGAAGLTIAVKIGAVKVYEDNLASIISEAAYRLAVISLALRRWSATTGRMTGRIDFIGTATTAGAGDLASIARSANVIVAPRPSAAALAIDWSAPQTVTVTVAHSVAATTVSYLHCLATLYSDRPAVPAAFVPPVVPVTTRDWLETIPAPAVRTRTMTGPLATLTAFPRASLGTMMQDPPTAAMACFDLACAKPTRAAGIGAAQVINPDLVWGRVDCPQEYQGWTDVAGRTGNGMPFDSTGPTTTGVGPVYAGHWLYFAGSTTSTALTATGTTVTVLDGSQFTVGQYLVIYSVPRASFAAAEHCEITGKSGNVLTLGRAYKSIGVAHPAGSIIAQHVIGNASPAHPLNWVFNIATTCPVDAAGKTYGQARAEAVAVFCDKTGTGTQAAAALGAVLWDSDFQWFQDGGAKTARACDADNDGAADAAVSALGDNLWGNGLDAMAAWLRAALDARGLTQVMILGGDLRAAGLDAGNGLQAEAALDCSYTNGSAILDYRRVDSDLAILFARRAYSAFGPVIVDVHVRPATLTNPGAANPPPTSDAPARLAMAAALLVDGSFSPKNWVGGLADIYYPWMAVVTTPGSPLYGTSVDKTDYTARMAHRRYLGEATSAPVRIYDADVFIAENNLFANGSFEADAAGWSGNRCTAARSTVRAYAGSGSLLLTPTAPVSAYIEDARATGPTVALTAGQMHAVCWAAWSATTRRIAPRLGANLASEGFTVWGGKGWQKFVWAVRPTVGGNFALQFDVGQSGAPVHVDQIWIGRGNPDVFRRDFAQGIVVANMSPVAVTVGLGGPFLRIPGPFEPPWDGTPITTLSLPPYDAAILLRPDA